MSPRALIVAAILCAVLAAVCLLGLRDMAGWWAVVWAMVAIVASNVTCLVVYGVTEVSDGG